MPLIHYNAPYLQYYLFHYLPAATTIALLPATESTEFPLEEMLVYIFFLLMMAAVIPQMMEKSIARHISRPIIFIKIYIFFNLFKVNMKSCS